MLVAGWKLALHMYLRYVASYENHVSGKTGTGIFRSADFVRDHTSIDKETNTRLQTIITWFDDNLPVPDFYDDPVSRKEENHTYFWFKTSAQNFIDKMEELCAIVEPHGIRIERLSSTEHPGKLIFEDECQIAVVLLDNFERMK